MQVRLQVRDYLGLRQAEWSPTGVSVLIGPSGSGKETLIGVVDHLRQVWEAPELCSRPLGAQIVISVDGETWNVTCDSPDHPPRRYPEAPPEAVAALLSGSRKSSRFISPDIVSSLLKKWKNSPADTYRYHFVLDTLVEMFSLHEDLLNSEGIPLSPERFPLLSRATHRAMRSLIPVAWAEDRCVAAIDAPETGLDPWAVRYMLECVRDHARDHSLTVLLPTHSPFVVNCFNRNADEEYLFPYELSPDHVYVLAPLRKNSGVDLKHEEEGGGQLTLPWALTDHYASEWLSWYKLSDLYMNNEFYDTM